MNKKIKFGKYIIPLLIFLFVFSSLSILPNHTSISYKNFNNVNSEPNSVKNSAITPLTLKTEETLQDLSAAEPQNYSINLNPGQYLVWVELNANEINVMIQISNNSLFTDIIITTDKYGECDDERTIFTVNSTTSTFYIRVSCPSGSGLFDIIVTDFLTEGYTEFDLGTSYQSISIIGTTTIEYFTTLTSGNYEIKIYVQTSLGPLSVGVSDDLLFNNIIGSGNPSGPFAIETISLTLTIATTIYIRVRDPNANSVIDLTVLSVSDPSGNDDDDSSDDTNELSPFENPILLIILIASVVGVSIPSLYIIRSRQKKAKQFTPQKKRLQRITSIYIDNSKLVKICTGPPALERVQESKSLITTISAEFLEAIKQFEWDENDKRDFLKEMLALSPKRRFEILNEMIQKPKIKEDIEEES